MKNLIISLLLIFSHFSICAQFGQLLEGAYEDTLANGKYELLIGWSHSSTVFRTPEQAKVQQTLDSLLQQNPNPDSLSIHYYDFYPPIYSTNLARRRLERIANWIRERYQLPISFHAHRIHEKRYQKILDYGKHKRLIQIFTHFL